MTHDRETMRQQMLLRALWRDARPGVLQGWLHDAHAAPGLRAYRTNAGASAERALATAFPTVAQLIGDESFGALARAFWHAEPPQRGDLALFGEGLPAFIAASDQLASEPYLAACARLDWAVHRAEAAADSAAAPAGLERLANDDPARLHLHLRPGSVLIESAHPIVTIWHAHRSDAADRFAPVRAAFAEQRAEAALVWRDGWRAQVGVLAPSDIAFTRALLDGATLAGAFERADADFSFEPWLLRALQEHWVAAIEPAPEE